VSPVWPGNPVMRLGRRWMRSSWCRIAAASGPVVSGGEVAQAVLHHRPGALTARPRSPPSSSRPRSTAWSTPVRWWCCTPRGTGCRYPPWPAGCSRWASRRPSRRTWPRAGPTVPVGAVIAARPAVSLVGSYELLVWLIRTCGAADRGPSTAHLCTGAACRAARRPVPASAVDGERPGKSGSVWRPAGRRAGQSPIPASGQRDDKVSEDSAVNDAVAAYRLSVQAGNPLSERRLAQMFGRTSRRWARARIAEARQASPLPDSPSTPVTAYP